MNGLPNYPDGFTATTGIGRMVVSVQSHPSADSAWPGTTCWSSTA